MTTALAERIPVLVHQHEDIDISSIKVGDRFRQDLGDVSVLAESIQSIGLLQPIVVTNDNLLVAGERRLEAFKMLGWLRIPVRRVNLQSVVQGEHDENEVRKAFTPSERVAIAEAVKTSLGERRGRPSEENTDNCPGLEGETRNIAAQRSGFSSGKQFERARSVVQSGTPALVEAMDAGRVSISAAATIAKQPAEAQSAILATQQPAKAAAELRASNDNHNHRAQGTGENEWYTPAKYVEMAREVMGTFDVDPASNPIAQKTVGAATFYTAETNGLDKEWNGKVWLNPPYAQPAISHFADKVVEEYQSGRMTEAIVLTHNYTDTGWFQKLAPVSSAICFTRGRIRFESPTGDKASPTQGQAFFYFGPNADRFRDVFGEVGFVR